MPIATSGARRLHRRQLREIGVLSGSAACARCALNTNVAAAKRPSAPRKARIGLAIRVLRRQLAQGRFVALRQDERSGGSFVRTNPTNMRAQTASSWSSRPRAQTLRVANTRGRASEDARPASGGAVRSVRFSNHYGLVHGFFGTCSDGPSGV